MRRSLLFTSHGARQLRTSEPASQSGERDVVSHQTRYGDGDPER